MEINTKTVRRIKTYLKGRLQWVTLKGELSGSCHCCSSGTSSGTSPIFISQMSAGTRYVLMNPAGKQSQEVLLTLKRPRLSESKNEAFL